MTDIRIINVSNVEGVWTDLLFNSATGTLSEEDELANIVKVALMTDALADVEETLPDPDSEDRRGWWGDYQAKEIWDGWPIGCKNWLLTRAKITQREAAEGSTKARAEMYTRLALQPLIEKRMCSAVDVVVTRVEMTRLDVDVTLYRGPRREIELKYQILWADVRR